MTETKFIQDLLVTSSWALPLVVGLVEVIKRALAKKLDARYLPLISIIIGLAVGLVAIKLSIAGGIVGVILGLGGVGLWEFGKNTVAGK